jgi:hypothetical protein
MRESETFDRLTPEARKVLSLAQEEAQRFNHNYIGTEHLLLGLARLEEGISTTVLNNLGVELDKVRRTVEFIIGRGDRIVLGEIGLTPRAKKVIELSWDEAKRIQHEALAPEHILLGLVHEGEGIAAGVLESLGVSLEKVRRETYRVLGLEPPQQEEPETSRAEASTQARISFSSPVPPTLFPPGPFSSGASGPFPPGAGFPLSPSPRTTPEYGLLHHHRPWHIDSEQHQKTSVGAGTTPRPIHFVRQPIACGTQLGWVIVNTGGEFTLTLYDGLADDAPTLAVMHHPPTGACFQFHALVRQGLAYTLEGSPGSVTIIYEEALEQPGD